MLSYIHLGRYLVVTIYKSSDAKPVIVIPHEREREELEETVGDAAAILFMTTPGKVVSNL